MKNSTEEEIVELVDEEAKMKISRNLKDDIITATLVMTRTVYDEKLVEFMKERVKKADTDTLEYIMDHIFDIILDEVKKLL